MPPASRREKLEAMLGQSPNDPFLMYGIALELLKEGDAEAGIRRLMDLVEAHPDYHAAYFQLGQACINEGETEAARDWLSRGVEVARRLGNAHAAGEMEGLLLTI